MNKRQTADFDAFTQVHVRETEPGGQGATPAALRNFDGTGGNTFDQKTRMYGMFRPRDYTAGM